MPYRNLAEIEQSDGLPDRISQFAKYTERFLVVPARRRQITLLRMKRRQIRQGRGDLSRIFQTSVYDEAFSQHRLGFAVVALVDGQCTAHVQRMGAGDVRLYAR